MSNNTVADRNFYIESAKRPLSEGHPKPSQVLRSLATLSSLAADYIDHRAFACKIDKGKFIVKPGQVCPYLFLIVKGVLRGFIKDGHKELTTWFGSEGDVVSSITSFFDQTPSLESVQALEDCELVGIYFSDLEYLYKHFPESNVAARLLLQAYYRQAEERAFISRLSKASDRFLNFQQAKPHLLGRVSYKIIASHLGITMETLSRMRNSPAKSLPELAKSY